MAIPMFHSDMPHQDPPMFQSEQLQSVQSPTEELQMVTSQSPPHASGDNNITYLPFNWGARPCIVPNSTTPIMRLPVELISDILMAFLEDQCPNLISIKNTGCIPENSELDGLHASSSLISTQIRKEQRIISPLLGVSKFFYRLVSEYMLRSSIYISGFQALQRLRQFQYSRYMPWTHLLSRPGWSVVVDERLFRKEGERITAVNTPRIRRIRLPDIRRINEVTFDRTGEGICWNMKRTAQCWVPKGWEMFPEWLSGGSYRLRSLINGEQEDMDGEEIPEHDHTFSFLESAKTVILGPDKKSWDIEWKMRYVGNKYGGTPDLEYASPSIYLLNKVILSLGETPHLEKLVISGNALKNTFWLMPKPIGEFNPLCRLTHLTLSLPESSSIQETPLYRLQQYIKTPNDAHLCNLLTCKGGDGKPLEDLEVPFVRTLKYLHVRGPGAHVCSNLFKAEWVALESVIIEMGTHRGICNGKIEDLLHHAKLAAHDYPQMSIVLTMRICDVECDKPFFGHHFWREHTSPIPTAQTLAEYAGTGEVFTLFKKFPGPGLPFVLCGQPMDEINFFINREWLEATECVNRFQDVDGLDVHTMVYDHNVIWKQAEEEARLWPEFNEDPLFIDEDTIERLQERMDIEWMDSAKLLGNLCRVDPMF